MSFIPARERRQGNDAMTNKEHFEDYHHPAGGWGSLKAVAGALMQEHVAWQGSRVLMQQNKPDGFACVSCSWAKPANPHPFEFCENGARATAWEITQKRVEPEFFLNHTLSELRDWQDHDLEAQGRLTAPLRWDAALDKYVEIGWEQAYAEIGAALRDYDPRSAVFYSSGRASLEASYMYQLMARLYGSNNLPDSSNMCHESTGVALYETIGVGVGTVDLADFEQTDCIFFFGQNVGTNSPRMLHPLQDARRRGVPIITFNPLREPGLLSFANPQSPQEMLSAAETQISTQYHQVRAGGDSAALMGMCKALLELDDEAQLNRTFRILDVDFIAEHTHGFEAYAQSLRAAQWSDIEREAGLTRGALRAATAVYARSRAVIGIYGMGLTQHRQGVQNVQMLSNLLLMRGNIGKPGAGICPVRGHSNVQGQRTVGITEKTKLAPLDTLARLYQFEPPRQDGLNTVEACEQILAGKINAFIGLGGNFVRAVPETRLIEAAWQDIGLTVQIATKLNRSHLVHGRQAYLLPCLGRIEIDTQAGGTQSVSVEDSTGHMHPSRGVSAPASPQLRSEPAIIAGIAQALLPPNPHIDWNAWVADYGLVRDAIARTYPEIFHDFNARLGTPGGFRRPLAACQRKWNTDTGKANFKVPQSLVEDADMPAEGADVLRLFTVRSDSQFNTTVYTLDDRFRGVYGTRRVLLMHADDIARLGFADGDLVDALTVAGDDVKRRVDGLRVTRHDLPQGCVAGYYPECNPLIPLWHHAKGSKVPAAKSIPVRLERSSP
jgi:molybdopterin-dependent oxidoreductase alpha subunit